MLSDIKKNESKPEILAPAGSTDSFLSAIAAGADAVYCGLKMFSARMAATNFSIKELFKLTVLAHDNGVKVYVALNTLVKPDEIEKAGSIVNKLVKYVKPDGLIVQDLAFLTLAKSAGYKGEIHLSTLANVSSPSALKVLGDFGIDRVVLPRELNIDEIKKMAENVPKDLSLEVFVHGALCYGVSGRCYWSSFFGGKSGLRGRCVQPCRRLYKQKKGMGKRFFSCQDFSVDVLVKALLTIPAISALKIEGRKKGPHYVYYTVKAYRLLRDNISDPKVKKEALWYLNNALSRKSSHYNFLPQRSFSPIDIEGDTGSGLLIGTVKGSLTQSYLIPKDELFCGDLLRIGYEDQAWHKIVRVSRAVPKHGRLHLKLVSHKKGSKIPVFLIDRREVFLEKQIASLTKKLENISELSFNASEFQFKFETGTGKKNTGKKLNVSVSRGGRQEFVGTKGLWINRNSIREVSKKEYASSWWWLPPVIWPDEEEGVEKLVNIIIRNKGKNFVLNACWQKAFFKNSKNFNLWAGPFCNISNTLSIDILLREGFAGVIVSPELNREDFLNLGEQSSALLGVVEFGMWPLCVSRTISESVKLEEPFVSPLKEQAWVKKCDGNYFVFPGWNFDIRKHRKVLEKAGYSMFVTLNEKLPKKLALSCRPGEWNWNLRLL